MLPALAASFMGGKGAPGFSSTSSSKAEGGTSLSGWYQGDIVLNTGSGSATSGDRTAPPAIGATGADGAVYGVGFGGGGFGSKEILIAGAIVLGAVLWRLSR